VRIWVQTRGTARAADYAFLGAAPERPWWREYRDVTAFDHPTVLVTSDGERWAGYLSGIPSARVDAVGTVVRWTLVLDGQCGAPDAGCLVAAVGAWLDDVASGGGRLPAALDAAFPAEDVQRGPAEVPLRASEALAALPVPPGAEDEPGSWLGAVAAPGARRAFLARVAALVAGSRGRALLLNLVDGPGDAAALLDPGSPVAVLVDGPDRGITPLRGGVEAKKAPVPPRPRAARIALLPLVAGTAVLVLLLTALILLL
jgi:hypothetical protein